MSDQLIVERSGLEKKDKSELQTIVTALGGSAPSRARKADLIDQILDLAGATAAEEAGDAEPSDGARADDEPSGETAGGRADQDRADQDRADQDRADQDRADQDRADEHEADQDAAGDDGADRTEEDRSGQDGPDNGAGGDSSDKDRAEKDSSGKGSSDKDRADKDRADKDRADKDWDEGDRGGAGRGSGSRTDPSRSEGRSDVDGGRSRNRRGRGRGGSDASGNYPVGPDGEPLAAWELEVMGDQPGGNRTDRNDKADKADGRSGGRSDRSGRRGSTQQDAGRGDQRKGNNGSNDNQGGNNQGGNNQGGQDDNDPNSRRTRRRGRGRGRDDANTDAPNTEPVPVDGYLDLRDEGYGFLRVDGSLPSKDDVYVSVKQVRQFGLRRGDRITGLSRPANRNEKNPGFHEIETVNGGPPEEGRNRVHFDDLTPLFPDERLVMEMRDEPLNMTTRIIDLLSPIGKGQRGLIVSPPKAGKTTILKDIARAVETNNPEVGLMILLLDERPEEVTDIERSLERGEVVSSTFDRPPEEHCAVAELAIERAKRLVEQGRDVVMIVDGITRLARAYNLTASLSGRAMSGGLDAAALYPPKRFFGAARNLEEGGSLTILATALVETGSKMDEVIFEEFKGTGNFELRLDRHLAEKRIFPAIDVDGSSTRHEELLFDRAQLQQSWKLRRVLSGMSEEGSSAAAIEMLIDRLKTFKTNADFLAEIGKSPSV
ncbi:MAG: transcription termination factor Rho [Acidimicrobiales bacterium]